MHRIVAALALVFCLTAGLAAAPPTSPKVTTPEAAFGFTLGTDRKLADWTQLVAYYQTLARESPRVRFANLGPTTEGRPFVLVTISAPENLARLEHYRQINAALADPRRTTPAQAQELIAQGKSILVLTVNIHSTEIASSQTAAQFAYDMATEDTPEVREILRDDIILLVPSLNPDGQQLVVDWYKKYLGTPYEGMGPVVLYQKYVGHDDNRDWYMFTQKETRLTVEKVLGPWRPQVLYDVHQMGPTGPRLFLPPWVDPIDPNVDPILVASMNALGMDTARDLIGQGMDGVLVDGVYDGWSPARQYAVYHGGLRLLSESASARIASPVDIPFDRLGRGIGYDAKVSKWNFPNPWPGGHWTLGDIVKYQLAAFFSVAHNVAMNREEFLRNYYTVNQHAVERRGSYIVPAEQSDPLATATLINTLREGGVEIERATADFEAGGNAYPAGSYIIRLGQPNGAFAKTLLEDQHYPDLRQYPGGPPQRPYDVTAQTLPLLLGVKVAAVADPVAAAAAPVTATVTAAPGRVAAGIDAAGYRLATQGQDALLATFALLRRQVAMERADDGTLYVRAGAGAEAALAQATRRFAVSATPVATLPSGLQTLHSPRVGLYASWVAQIDEGWTRFIFDQDGIPYTSIHDADLRAGDLRQRFDAILIPDQNPRSLINGNPAGRVPPEYAGGLGEDGTAALKTFVQQGGTLIALNQASLAFLDWTDGQVKDALAGDRAYYSPGSILQVSSHAEVSPAWGAPSTVAIFSLQSPAFALSGAAKSALDYSSDNPLLSGWLLGGDKLNGLSALATVPLGQGRLVLFGFKPQYRAQSQATYRYLFNAMLESAATK